MVANLCKEQDKRYDADNFFFFAESPSPPPSAIFSKGDELDWLDQYISQLISEEGQNIGAWELDIKDELFSNAAIQEAEAEPTAAVEVVPSDNVVQPPHAEEVPTEAWPDKNLDALFQAASELEFSQLQFADTPISGDKIPFPRAGEKSRWTHFLWLEKTRTMKACQQSLLDHNK